MVKFPTRLTEEALEELQYLDIENMPALNSPSARAESEMTDCRQHPLDLNCDDVSKGSFQGPFPEIVVPENIVSPNDQEPTYDGDISDHQTAAPRWVRKRGKQGGKNTKGGRARRRQQQQQHGNGDDGDDQDEEDRHGEDQDGVEKAEDDRDEDEQDPDQRNDDKSESEHQDFNKPPQSNEAQDLDNANNDGDGDNDNDEELDEADLDTLEFHGYLPGDRKSDGEDDEGEEDGKGHQNAQHISGLAVSAAEP